MSEDGLSGGRMVEDNKSREKETVDQKKDDRRQNMQHKKGTQVSGEGMPGGKTVKVDDIRERGHSVLQESSFADVVSQGKARKAHVFIGDSIIREGTSAIFGKYRRLIKTLKEARVGHIVLSRILPIMGGRGEEYRTCRRMAINTQVQKVWRRE